MDARAGNDPQPELAAVPVGIEFRTASPLAVLLTALTLFLSAPPLTLVVTSGLCATAYLVMQPETGTTYVAPTKATILAALGFSLIGAVVATFTFDFAWLLVVAPFVLLVPYAVAIHLYLRRSRHS